MAVAELARRYGVEWVAVSAYHPQANGIIERGHKSILRCSVKNSDGGLLTGIEICQQSLGRSINCVHQLA